MSDAPIDRKTPTRVCRNGKLMWVRHEDMQSGDIQITAHDTEKEVEARDHIPMGTRRVKVLVMGPDTTHQVNIDGLWAFVPAWVVMDDGRAYKLDRLFRKDGTAEVENGEMVYPGGAVFRPTFKDAAMRRAESDARIEFALRKPQTPSKLLFN